MLIQSEKDVAQAVMQLTAVVPNLKGKQNELLFFTSREIGDGFNQKNYNGKKQKGHGGS